MNKRRHERQSSRIVAAALIMGGVLAACAPQQLSADGSGTTVAPGGMRVTDQPAYMQRYPCGGAQARCWGVPSW